MRPLLRSSLLWLLLLGGMPSPCVAQLAVKQVAHLDRGIYWTMANIVPYRARPGGTPLLVFHAGMPGGATGLHFYRYVPVNRYVLARVDTGAVSPPPGVVVPGNLGPWAAGDVDGDSASELVGFNGEDKTSGWYILATMYGSSERTHCPDSLVWSVRYDSNPIGYGNEPFYITDLDQDGHKKWNVK